MFQCQFEMQITARHYSLIVRVLKLLNNIVKYITLLYVYEVYFSP